MSLNSCDMSGTPTLHALSLFHPLDFVLDIGVLQISHLYLVLASSSVTPPVFDL